MREKVIEPYITYVVECPRCKQTHCGECIDFHEIDFETKDPEETWLFDEKTIKYINWKGEKVCPWCYNQLIEFEKTK